MAKEEKLEEAKRLYETANADQKYVLERLFPELRGSEDERIRKELISFLKSPFVNENITDEKVTPWIAWLEKQGEHKKFRDAIQVGDKVTRNEDGVLVNLSQLNRVAKPADKQGEQKPAWSEQDEVMIKIFDSIIRYIVEVVDKNALERFGTKREKLFSWLKSIKDRAGCKVNCITTKEWSKDDDYTIERLFCLLNNEQDNYPLLSCDFQEIQEIKEWLKSLRSQNTWKPSDEQIMALRWVLNNVPYNKYKEEISGLLDQIKEL